jgi:hypothetical protein
LWVVENARNPYTARVTTDRPRFHTVAERSDNASVSNLLNRPTERTNFP